MTGKPKHLSLRIDEDLLRKFEYVAKYDDRSMNWYLLHLIKNEIAELRDDGKMSLDLFYRDPYMLDFLGLRDTYSEKDLENAILAELEKFILEMGSDFAFLARQEHLVLDGKKNYAIFQDVLAKIK